MSGGMVRNAPATRSRCIRICRKDGLFIGLGCLGNESRMQSNRCLLLLIKNKIYITYGKHIIYQDFADTAKYLRAAAGIKSLGVANPVPPKNANHIN